MKIIILTLSIVLISCNLEKDTKHDTYAFMKNEIEIYDDLLNLKNYNYSIRNDSVMWHEINILINHYNEFNRDVNEYIEILKGNKLEERYKKNISKELTKMVKLENSNCYKTLGGFKDVTITDTMYFHKRKFEYIKCIIISSPFIDSIPKLKERILDTPHTHPLGYYYDSPKEMWYDTLDNGELKERLR